MNLLLLVALLSMLQATLTLPGIAAIALTLGMAIDANVLINERIREELRWRQHAAGRDPGRLRARVGHDSRLEHHDADRRYRAVRVRLAARCKGFAVVHCLGILTSMFSAVLVSRGIVNLIYGSRKKLEQISIGQVWKPRDRRSQVAREVAARPAARRFKTEGRQWNFSASSATSRSCAMR